MLLTEIRKAFQKRLGDQSIDLISEITTDSIDIKEKNLEGKTEKNISEPLKKVTITGLTKLGFDKIWKLNLEPENTLFKSSAKVTEIAIVTLSRAHKLLTVYLIEMKSSIVGKPPKKDRLKNIHEKLNESIGRFYHLVLINIHNETEYKGVEVKFKGVIFFNRDEVKKNAVGQIDCSQFGESRQLCKIFTQKNREGTLRCDTFLGPNVIPVKFIQNPNKDKKTGKFSDHFSVGIDSFWYCPRRSTKK
jgi:hypothetical protein